MANGCLTFAVLLQIILFNNVYCANEFTENLDEFYRPQIHSLVRHLNQDRNRVYNYNYATLINAQNKDADNLDLTVDIELECRIPELCITDIATCTGTIQYNTESASYEVLRGVACQPKTRLNLGRDETPAEEEHEEEYVRKDEAEAPEEEKPKDYCVGCPEDVNTNVEGVDALADVAVQHIESERENKLVVLKVLNVQRQIVAGVKYTLLLEVASTFCPKTVEPQYIESCTPDRQAPTEVCQITYFQQPWINKRKHIIANNCTHAQQFSVEVPAPADKSNEMDNEIDANYNYNKIMNAGDMGGIMSPARMRDVESQIVYKKPVDMDSEITTTSESSLSDSQKAAIEDFLDMMGDEPRVKRAVKNDNDDNNNNNDDSSSSSSSSSSEEEDNHKEEKKSKGKQKKSHKHDDDDDDDDDDDNNNNNNNKNGDDSSSSSSSDSSSDEENNHDDNHIEKRKHKKARSKSNVDNNTSESNETSEEDKKKGDVKDDTSEELGKEKPTPILQKRSVNNNLEASEESIESDEDKETEAMNEEPKNENKLIAKKEVSEESVDQEDIIIRRRRSLDNQLTKIADNEKVFVHNLATVAINELDEIDADNHKRLVLQILGAKKMYDNGYVYHITMRVGVSHCPESPTGTTDLNKPYPIDNCYDTLFEYLTKICKVQVHVDVDKKNPKILKSHCQDIKKSVSEYTHKSERGNRTHRDKRGGIPGGVNTVDPKDPQIDKFVRELLGQLDAEKGHKTKQELKEVISATKQVVAGLKYTLKVKIEHEGKTKICNYVVWQRAWMTPSKEVSETCDDAPTENKYRFRRSTDIFTDQDSELEIDVFKRFMKTHGKKYDDKKEFKRRFNIFKDNLKKIKLLNSNEQGTAVYAATVFADMTEEEFAKYKGLKPELRNKNEIPFPKAQIPDIDIPVEFDWRKKGVISEVKNQGSCGSCWAFSVTGNIEGLNAIKTGKMVELSEQELVDCDSTDNGCGGGLMDNAYRAIEKLGGLETEQDYPYEAENEKCTYNKSLARVQITGAVNISTNELDMAKWLVKNGPISIGLNANAMQFYMGGVSHPWSFLCDPKNIDHGVLLVGYGVSKYPLFNKTMPYWIIKNSWGQTWGEQGYYRIYRGEGTCGVNTMPESAVL